MHFKNPMRTSVRIQLLVIHVGGDRNRDVVEFLSTVNGITDTLFASSKIVKLLKGIEINV